MLELVVKKQNKCENADNFQPIVFVIEKEMITLKLIKNIFKRLKFNMEQTLVILKPSTVMRGLMGEVISRFEKKGLIIAGMKMIQLNDEILAEHYSHLVSKPFFPMLKRSMMESPVVVMCVRGVEAVSVVRGMTGATNSRKAEPGTIRGDYSMSGQQNIVHASDSVENAEIELNRFFKKEEIFEYGADNYKYLYAEDEF